MPDIKIPNSIEIGGFTYKIKWDRETKTDLEEEPCWGKSRHIQRTISLDNTMEGDQLCDSFLHELIHCLEAVYLRLHWQEEDVERLANGLHQIFKQLGIKFTL